MNVTRLSTLCLSLVLPLTALGQHSQGTLDLGPTFTNSIDMEFVRIEPGSFSRGSAEGDLNEEPVHVVEIREPFYFGSFEVTNAQYEQFDPDHRQLRGKLEYSMEDDEAVVFVSWHDAMAFAEWLSEREGLPYRLPTEAEWEYAARAGTTTPYHTGDTLPEAFHKNPRASWYPDHERLHDDDVVDLTVGQTPPNEWGIYDMHGNVEEWTMDWYGPYEPNTGLIDPVGRTDGDFKVTRGGSHSTDLYYLRSANRMAALPDTRNWLTGIRLVIGAMPDTPPLPERETHQLFRTDVAQESPIDVAQGPDPGSPYFDGPRPYVKLNPTERGPFFYHNHQVDISEMPNGDLMAIWYTTKSETGRYLRQAASRLRHGQEEWDPASIFWNVPDRNDHGNALWWDGEETIYHFSGMSAAATWGNLALIMRTSTDNGASWSRARIINPEFGLRNQVISSVIRTHDGSIVVAADAVSTGEGGTAIHVSRDNGETWSDPGGTIAGIHASVVQLQDGRLMAFGRGDNIEGRMPKSISDDMGATWTYSASEFPPIASTQRLVLIRLQEGPLFFASFADNLSFEDAAGNEYRGSGLFGALSYDEGKTWPLRKLIVPEESGYWLETARSRHFVLTPHTAEPRGYLAATQARNGVIHLLSTSQHYAFNLEWLREPRPAVRDLSLARKAQLEARFDGRAIAEEDPIMERLSYVGSSISQQNAAVVADDGLIDFDIPQDASAHWLDRSPRGFGSADTTQGATVEVRLQVLENERPDRGVDLVAHLGDGNRRFYHISVTRDGVYAWDSFSMVPLAQNLDNAGGMHTYRMAVGDDRLARIYRDDELIAVRSPAQYRHPNVSGDGPYLYVGAAGKARARIEHAAYDTGGGFAP